MEMTHRKHYEWPCSVDLKIEVIREYAAIALFHFHRRSDINENNNSIEVIPETTEKIINLYLQN